jgi:type IV secretion system protein VirB11
MSEPGSESVQRILEKLKKELGPTVRKGLEDPAVVDIILNPDGKIWIGKIGKPMEDTGETMSFVMAQAMLGTVATTLHTEINRENPVLEGELQLDGSRIEGLLPPATAAPAFAIRKRASFIFPLSAYVEEGRMTKKQKSAIQGAVKEKKNIIICGGTGSGKTTLGNAILLELSEQCPGDRALILEDTVELQCRLKNKTELRTWPKGGLMTLLRAAMRLRPDRIIVGEVRGGEEAMEMLKAWNTGHPGGFATLHADDPLNALARLENLITETGIVPNPRQIAQAVDIVVFISQAAQIGPKVQSIVDVQGFENGKYKLIDIA